MGLWFKVNTKKYEHSNSMVLDPFLAAVGVKAKTDHLTPNRTRSFLVFLKEANKSNEHKA